MSLRTNEIRQAVGDANKFCREQNADRKWHARRATKLATELTGAEGAEAVAILSQLQQVQRGELAFTQEMNLRAGKEIARVKQARAANEEHRKILARDRAADILGQALVELGYKPEKDFVTAFAQGETVFQRPEWEKEGYFCRVKVDPETHSVNFRIVCDADVPVDRRRGGVVEEAWCKSFDLLQKKLTEKKMALEISRRTLAGAEQIERVAKRGKRKEGSRAAGAAIERRLPGQ